MTQSSRQPPRTRCISVHEQKKSNNQAITLRFLFLFATVRAAPPEYLALQCLLFILAYRTNIILFLYLIRSHYQVVCTGRYMSCRFVHYVRYLMYEEPESLVRYRKYKPKQVNSKFTFNGMSQCCKNRISINSTNIVGSRRNFSREKNYAIGF